MGEKDYIFKNSPWEESTRIPYIIKAPGGKNGAKVKHPVSLIDIYPTLTDLCQLTGDNRKNEAGGSIGGVSLKSFLQNPKTKKWNGPNGALTMVGNGLNKKEVMKQTYSYRTEDWRYIRYMDGNEELYHNKIDPFEWENLAENEKYNSTKEELKTEMFELINTHQ
jgi:arylsulfatase A-like enzyme